MNRNRTPLAPETRPGPVLGLDTCGAEATLALGYVVGGGLELLREVTVRPKMAGALLTVALRDLLSEIKPAELGAIVVVRGPGSFTGMRIGLAAVKALAEAAMTPVVAVSRLAVLAETSGARFTALDAGRGNVYLLDTAVQGEAAEAMLTADEVRVRLAGDAQGHSQSDSQSCAQSYLQDYSQSCGWASAQGYSQSNAQSSMPEEQTRLAVCEDEVQALFPEARRVAAPTAVAALRHGLARVLQGDWDDVARLDALYLWQAEQMLSPSAPKPVIAL